MQSLSFRILTALTLVAFLASSCSSYRWAPEAPAEFEEDPQALVGERVRLTFQDGSTVVLEVAEYQEPFIRGWVLVHDKKKRRYDRSESTAEYDLRQVESIEMREQYRTAKPVWVPLGILVVVFAIAFLVSDTGVDFDFSEAP